MTTTDVSGRGWLPFGDPREAAHHAHLAYLHAGTRAVLILLWFGTEEAVSGWWEWEVRVPGGYRDRYVPLLPLDPPTVPIAWADRAVERLMQYREEGHL